MSKKSKRKGSNGERELAGILKKRGYKVYRTYASGAGLEKGDLGGFETKKDITFHVECKRQERLNVHQWWMQAVKDCPPESHPIVVFRRNREDWRVVVELETFLEILEN